MRQTIFALLITAGIADAAEFHVAPDGNDVNPGTAEKPFSTLERARDAMRGGGGGDVVVHGGTYVLQRTLELTPADSGSANKPVRFMAAKGETPVVTSLREITGWVRYKDNIWAADVSKGWRFHRLYVNGEAQRVACTPKSGVKTWRSWPRIQPKPLMTPDGLRVTLPPGLLKGMPDNGDVEVNFLPVQFWNALTILKKVDGDTAILASRNPCTWEFGGNYCMDGNIRFQNALVALTEPGEWCVDSAAGKVYYWPPDGTLDGKKVMAPTLCELVRLQGDDMAARSNAWRVKYDAAGHRMEKTTPTPAYSSPSAFDQRVRYVEFWGLTFEGTDRLPEDQWPADWLKRNCENPDGTLYLQGVEACAICNCTFRNCGAYAVVLDHWARRVSVLGNEMSDLGSGGVQATGYGPGMLDVNGHHVIRRNYIHHTGRDYMHSAAVTVYGSNHNDVSLNWIAECPYAAVQISGVLSAALMSTPTGPTGASVDLYGDGTAQYQLRNHELPAQHPRCPGDYEEIKQYQHSGGNWVARNVVDHYMTTLGDGGALYCWSPDHDNVWWENILMHGAGHVIYMDDDTGRSVVASNLAWSPGDFFDNSHNPTPSGYAVPSGIRASGKTVIAWYGNVASFPKKPEGFDERLADIAALVRVQGGWPAALREQQGELENSNVKPVPLVPGAWIKAAEARRLVGPRLQEDRSAIGWCEGGGIVEFGPYQIPEGAAGKLEVSVGVAPDYGGRMHVRFGALDVPDAGMFTFQSTGGWDTFKDQSIPLKAPAGTHRLFFVFEGGGGICNLKQFRFIKD